MVTKRLLVLLPPYRRILDKSDDAEMESAVRALFSDALKMGERIIKHVLSFVLSSRTTCTP